MSVETGSSAPPEVLVINGASSTGKTTLAVALQDILSESWLVFGIDTLISAMPIALLEIHDDATIGARPREHEVRQGGITFDADGAIEIGDDFRRLEASWHIGLSAIAKSGTRFILDEVFLDGARSQDRLNHALAGHRVAWVGVTCDADVGERRQRSRGDRVVGMFERQSQRAHDGVHYDLVLDTTSSTPDELAQMIARRFNLAPA
jgi:chloramphenicol 3-O phosphotransferase